MDRAMAYVWLCKAHARIYESKMWNNGQMQGKSIYMWYGRKMNVAYCGVLKCTKRPIAVYMVEIQI